MSEPIRVLHVVTHMNRGGLETMIMNYYRHIDRTKIQFDFLTHRDEKKDYDDEILGLGGRIYHLPPMNPFDRNGYLKKLDEFFEEHKEYKIVHSHLDCMSAVPLKYAKKHGVKVRIAHSHNTSQEKNLKYLVKLYFRSLIPKYATELFACGEEAGKWMFGDKEFKVMRNAIDAKKFIYDEKTSEQQKKILRVENKFVLGHVGRFNVQKNHEFLIDIFNEVYKQNNNAVLLLIGTGELEEHIKEKVVNLHLQEVVRFLGVREDIPELLQAMDVFVFPSLFEGLGIVLIEAQASGLRCITSDVVVPKAAKVTELLNYMSLNEEASMWAEKIMKSIPCRKNTYSEICANGYDIQDNVNKLEEYYLGVLWKYE